MRESRRNLPSVELRSAILSARALRRWTLLFVSCLAIVPAAMPGQAPGPQIPPPGFPVNPGMNSLPFEKISPQMARQRLQALEVQRQKQIVADTETLLALARELSRQTARLNSADLTLDQFHKLAEIEKLAHKIRQNMIDGAGPPVIVQPSPFLFPRY